jgi:EAL domain-containing protein (putative c-di-GMP-specific phosphodiesterase class I)
LTRPRRSRRPRAGGNGWPRTCAAGARSTIDLGGNLGLDVVAEGVETREIWDKLQELGCQTAQGYYLSRPVPADALTEWLRARLPLPLPVAAATG